jgi:hypothetical protein
MQVGLGHPGLAPRAGLGGVYHIRYPCNKVGGFKRRDPQRLSHQP